MTRANWTPDELRGYRLAWLVEIHAVAGVVRVSTLDVREVDSDEGALRFEGSCEVLDWQEAIDLFSLTAEDDPLVVEAFVPLDLPTLSAQGHRLEGARVEVSTIRVRMSGTDGATAVDAYEDRCPVVVGYARDVEWGPYTQGASFVRLGVARPPIATRRKVPSRTYAVSRATWDTTYLSDADLVSYPLVIGYPGRDSLDQDGCFPAAKATWLSKQYQYHTLMVCLDRCDATTMRLFQKDGLVSGQDVTVGYEIMIARGGPTVIPSYDRLGQLVPVIDYPNNDIDAGDGSDIGAEYQPPVEEGADDHVFVGFTAAGGGGLLWRGAVLRDAGDVLEYMLEASGVPYDAGMCASAKPALSIYKVDCVVGEAVDPIAWLTENLLPLIPVSLVRGPRGVYPVVWPAFPTEADVELDLDADADPQLEPGDRLAESRENGATAITIRYGYNARTGRYRYTRRVGPDFVDSTDQATCQLRSNGSLGIVNLKWTTPGYDGDGVTVTCVDTGVLGATYTAATRTLAVTFQSGTDNEDTIAAYINTNIPDTCTATGSGGTTFWSATTTPSVRMTLTDFGTFEDPRLRGAYYRHGLADLGVDLPDEEQEIETDLYYAHGSVLSTLQWRAAAYGPVQRRWSVTGPEGTLCDARLGSVVRVTDSALGLDGALGTVEARQMRSDGLWGLRVVFCG